MRNTLSVDFTQKSRKQPAQLIADGIETPFPSLEWRDMCVWQRRAVPLSVKVLRKAVVVECDVDRRGLLRSGGKHLKGEGLKVREVNWCPADNEAL